MQIIKHNNRIYLLAKACLLATGLFMLSGTGSLFQHEAHAQVSKKATMALKKNDRNNDGKVSRKEWRKSSELFDQIDTNKDGFLTLQEFNARFSGNASAASWRGSDQYWQGPLIDAHSQIDEKTNTDQIVPLLDNAGVSTVILSTRFQQPSIDVIDLAESHPERIVPAAKTKTKEFFRDEGFPTVFYRELKAFNYRAMAEIIMWHAAKASVGAGEATLDPMDSRITPFIETAGEKKWPFIAHIEFADMGSEKPSYMNKFESLLSANRQLPIGLIHMGQLNAEDAKRLLPKHPNLFFITSHCNSFITDSSKLPWTKMFVGDRLAPEWEELVLKFPDRFVLAFDNVFSFQWENKFIPQVLVWRKALRQLPDDVAHALGHGNAERLWKLPPAALN